MARATNPRKRCAGPPIEAFVNLRSCDLRARRAPPRAPRSRSKSLSDVLRFAADLTIRSFLPAASAGLPTDPVQARGNRPRSVLAVGRDIESRRPRIGLTGRSDAASLIAWRRNALRDRVGLGYRRDPPCLRSRRRVDMPMIT